MIEFGNLSPEQLETARAMGNFWTRLPDDHYPEIPGIPHIRSGRFRVDVFRRGNLDELVYFDPVFRYKYSDLFIQQTWRNHFLRIDELIDKFHLKDSIQSSLNIGWEPDRIATLASVDKIAIGDERIPYEERLRVIMLRVQLSQWRSVVSLVALPIYKRLLEEGYTQEDLSR